MTEIILALVPIQNMLRGLRRSQRLWFDLQLKYVNRFFSSSYLQVVYGLPGSEGRVSK